MGVEIAVLVVIVTALVLISDETHHHPALVRSLAAVTRLTALTYKNLRGLPSLVASTALPGYELLILLDPA